MRILQVTEEERFAKIQSFIFANQKRFVTMKEISTYTGIYPKLIKKLIDEFDTSGELKKFIVDGRKHKQLRSSPPIIPQTLQTSQIPQTSQESQTLQTSQILQALQTTQIPQTSSLTMLEETIFQEETTKFSIFDIIEKEEKGQTKKIIFDGSIINNFRIESFFEILKDFKKDGIIPKFFVYSNDLLNLDKNKNFPLQKELIKFFAQDDGKFHKLISGMRPEGQSLAKLCKNRDYMLISGDAKNIAWCKLYGVEVHIPKYFLLRCPSPFHGDRKIAGLDSCMMAVKRDEIDALLYGYKSVLISDIQLNEIVAGSYLLSIIAYYGKIGYSIGTGADKDRDICEFYKWNPVDCVYTQDYGFQLFAEMAGISCALHKAETATESKILKEMLSSNNEEIKEGMQISLEETDWESEKLIIDNRLSAYSVSGIKRTKFAYSQDLVVFKKRDSLLIMQIKNKNVAIVRYFGTFEKVPNKYRFVLG